MWPFKFTSQESNVPILNSLRRITLSQSLRSWAKNLAYLHNVFASRRDFRNVEVGFRLNRDLIGPKKLDMLYFKKIGTKSGPRIEI
jgi:hypothetical protein